MCKDAVKKLPYLLRYVPVQYKPQQMSDKAADDYSHALEFVPECYKTQKMCDKAVDTHTITVKYVPECYKTQEMCKMFMDFFYLILFLINMKLKKYVA